MTGEFMAVLRFLSGGSSEGSPLVRRYQVQGACHVGGAAVDGKIRGSELTS
jgi:hypothetical protein